jgi:hypothetical protein
VKKTAKKLLAYYNGKVVDMAYVLHSPSAFSLACMRVTDNFREGYVIEDGKVYHVSRAFKIAKIIGGAPRDRVLAEVAKLMEVST